MKRSTTELEELNNMVESTCEREQHPLFITEILIMIAKLILPLNPFPKFQLYGGLNNYHETSAQRYFYCWRHVEIYQCFKGVTSLFSINKTLNQFKNDHFFLYGQMIQHICVKNGYINQFTFGLFTREETSKPERDLEYLKKELKLWKIPILFGPIDWKKLIKKEWKDSKELKLFF